MVALPELLADPLAVEVIREDEFLRGWLELSSSAFSSYVPDRDEPEKFHLPSAFYDARDSISILMGGNGSGKTEAAAAKCAKFLLRDQAPPRKDTPFWIISNTYDQVSGVCWQEKLCGHGHVPPCEIDWDRVRWLNVGLGWPLSVPLKPWPKERGGHADRNWCIEFKSFEQGRKALQARSIGGFWFSEQFPLDLFLEVLRACREYMYPGGQFCEFCPIEPDLCLWIEKIMDQRPKGWGFYRMNTECNRRHLADGWYEQFVAAIPDEMRDTRLTGALAQFEGVIFPTFSTKDVRDGGHILRGPIEIPVGVECLHTIDWGASVEHPFVHLWGYRDSRGVYTIYDEYWTNSQTVTLDDHVDEIQERTEDWQIGVTRRPDWRRDTTIADPENMIALRHFGKVGFAMAMANKNVDEGIDTVRTMLKYHPELGGPRLRIHERCKHLIEEMRKYRWERRSKSEIGGRTIAVSRPKPLKRDDDCVDALRYMLHTSERQQGLQVGSTSYGEWNRVHRTVQLDNRPQFAGAGSGVSYGNDWSNGHGNASATGYPRGSGQDRNGRR